MIKLLYGNEPYLIKEKIKKACAELSMPEMNISKIDVFGEDEMFLSRQYPFIDKKRIMILSLESINNADDMLKTYVSEPSETTDLYITVQNLDKRAALYKTLKQKNMLEECSKLSVPELNKFVLMQIRANGSNIDNAAFAILIEHLNYQDENVNLFNVVNSIKQLCFANKVITAEIIKELMEETVNEKAFAVFSMIASKDGAKAYQTILHLIETGENEIGLLSLILRNYRLIYKYRLLDGSMKEKAKSMGLSPYQVKFCAESLISEVQAEESMLIIEDAINAIKHGADSIVTCKNTVAKLLYIVSTV